MSAPYQMFPCDRCGMLLHPGHTSHGTLGAPCAGKPTGDGVWCIGRGKERRILSELEIKERGLGHV